MTYRVMAIQEEGSEILVASHLRDRPTPEQMQAYREEHEEWSNFTVETEIDWYARHAQRYMEDGPEQDWWDEYDD